MDTVIQEIHSAMEGRTGSDVAELLWVELWCQVRLLCHITLAHAGECGDGDGSERHAGLPT